VGIERDCQQSRKNVNFFVSTMPSPKGDFHVNKFLANIGQGRKIVRVRKKQRGMEFVDLRLHQSMHESPDGLEYGYFLNFGLASLLIAVNDGRSVEVGIVGREGFVGTPIAAGLNRTPNGARVQANGNGLRIKAEVLEVILSATPNLRLRLNQYAQIQGMQVAQLAACNRLHEIDQRLARCCSCARIGFVPTCYQ
jgi:hypothetical protein